MQNGKTFLPQADKSLAEQEINSVASSDRVEALVDGTCLMDFEGGQKFCMESALRSNSAQGGADGAVQDCTVMLERSDLPLCAPGNGAGNNIRLSYADHLKVLQSIAGGTGSLDEGQGLD